MKNHWILFGPLLFAVLASSFTLNGIYPNAGPTTGETRVTIFSSDFKGMNYSDHPTPKCQFPGSQPQAASWIHCIGADTSPNAPKDETCLNCETYEHAAGTFQVQVSITGNFDDTAEIDFTYYEPPTIDYLSPPLGGKKGGAFIQVHGQNFANFEGLSCGFSTVSMKATYVSPTLVTCQSPPSEVTDSPIPVRVTLNGQQYTATKSNFYYHSTPEISQLVPNEGSISGGTEVYIMGKRMHPFETTNVSFDNSTFARFGTDNYVKVELINSTHAKVISPPTISATPVPVEITFNDQEWTQNGILFNYYVSPYVVRLVPNFGPLTGGTNVTVFGANFYNSSDIKCRFGTTVVQGNYINDDSIWCTAPPSDDVKTVDFSLSVEANHFSSNKIEYQYVQKPSISGISPRCGPITGETQIAVTGKNFVFTGPNQVFCIFGTGNTYRQPATVINETLIYCDSPTVADKFGNNINNITTLRFHLTLNGLEIIESKFDFTYYTMPIISTINPKTGPIAGGTQVVVSGDNFNHSCHVTCRFSTYEVDGKVSADKKEITCKSPAATCPGQSLVQISLNGQQYTTNDHTNEATIFSNYKSPLVAYALPTSFPTAGDSSIGVYGSGFLLSRNTSTLPNGETRVSYQCRFKDASNKVLGVTNSTYFSDYYIHCKTPSLDAATDNVTLEISPNGQSWIPVPTETLSFYDSPAVLSVDPAFGKVKQTNATLTVKGRSFECQDADCKNVKCAFSGSNFRIVMDGRRESSQVIYCPIPSISRPEMTQVQVSLNGIDFTPQQVTYTFYDAFVVNVNPGFIPVEGNIPIKVLGFGFANTPELKVRLENATDGSVLHCANGSCVLPANFTSPTEISFTAPPQADMKGSDGASIGFRQFNVEVSVYGDSFTNDKVGLSFYQEPEVGGNITLSGAPTQFVIHQNAIGSIFVPVGLEIPQGISLEDFLRRTRTLCKYVVEGDTAITEGKIVEYPYPSAEDINLSDLSIECTAPQLNKSGDGTVSVSLNGVNFVGNLPIKVLPQLNISALTPRCGPREGGTRVDVQVGGVQQSEVTGFFFSWSSVCTNPFATGAFTQGNKISTVAPPAPLADTDGGYSLLVFSQNEQTSFRNTNLTQQRTINHFESSLDYLYYRRPTITKIYPHGGITTGGTPITIEGAFFFEDLRTACTPKCKFGETIVEATFISTVRLQCNSPPGKLGTFVPLTVTFNGQDEAVAAERQQFAYIGKPNVKSLSPAIGPATGGTMITVTGQGFVDMSQYPEEFACIFRPVSGPDAPKIIPAVYLNSTAVACSSPGGWQPGKDAEVEISFNGVDFSSNKVSFRFYQIDRIWPLSGPSAGGSIVTIYGTGLVPKIKKGKPACKINNVVVEATKATSKEIECKVPAAAGGPTFSGLVDFYYTLDGDKWEQALQGFNYYPQAEISQVNPKYVSANGGIVRVQGTNFNASFPGVNITCQINGNSTVQGQYVSETELNCPFRNINYNTRGDHYVQIALNGASYTGKSDQTKISIYKVGGILPRSGVVEGGTKLIVTGDNFPADTSPICRFGVPGRSASSNGTFMNDRQISCTVPPAILSDNIGETFMVPFSLSFDNETSSSTFDRSSVKFYYYSQPEIADITPSQAPIDQSTLVTITSSENSPFNHSIIGGTVVQQSSALDLDIICKFGRFGTTSGALISYNQIRCPTPTPRIDASNLTQETVQVQIALNGQDYLTAPTPFTFTGNQITASVSSSASWFMPLVTAFVVVSFIFYITNKRFPSFNKEEIPLVGNIQKSDAIVGQEPTMTKIIM